MTFNTITFVCRGEAHTWQSDLPDRDVADELAYRAVYVRESGMTPDGVVLYGLTPVAVQMTVTSPTGQTASTGFIVNGRDPGCLGDSGWAHDDATPSGHFRGGSSYATPHKWAWARSSDLDTIRAQRCTRCGIRTESRMVPGEPDQVSYFLAVAS